MSMRKKYMVTLVLVVAMVVMGSFPVMAEETVFTDKSSNNGAEGINVTSSDNRINPEELHDFNRRYQIIAGMFKIFGLQPENN